MATKRLHFIYKKVGKLVPVNKNNQPIPGADTPTYTTDPGDPTKVLNPTVPSIDSWQPKDKRPGDSVVPTNPGKDTPVIFVEKPQKPVMPVIPEQLKNPAVPNNSKHLATSTPHCRKLVMITIKQKQPWDWA